MTWSRILCLAFALLAGCGAGDETRHARDEPEPDPGLVDFDPAVNVCPHFEGSLVLPRSLLEGESAVVGVRATDPDSDDLTLTYRWSAPAGEFSEPSRAVTEYRCSEAGPQSLTVVASDLRRCDIELVLDISCDFE